MKAARSLRPMVWTLGVALENLVATRVRATPEAPGMWLEASLAKKFHESKPLGVKKDEYIYVLVFIKSPF